MAGYDIFGTGHHLSLDYSIVDGFWLAKTTMLFAAEPAEFGMFKPMKDEGDRGIDLSYSFDRCRSARVGRSSINVARPPDSSPASQS